MGCDKVKKRGPEAQKLLEYGFKNFSTVEAVKKGASFGPVRVKRGKVNEVMLLSSETAWVTVAKGKEKSVTVLPELPHFVVAPIKNGQVLSKMAVQKEGKTLKEVGLLASSDVEKSLLPSWPVLLVVVLALCLIGGGVFWWVRRSQTKKYG